VGVDEDIFSLQELVTYGIKGTAAYAAHAYAVGTVSSKTDPRAFTPALSVNSASCTVLFSVAKCLLLCAQSRQLLGSRSVTASLCHCVTV